ncbi:hypothetical protein KEF85_12605 [Methylomonas paludis]|uniref:Uncharacterized protein n=1 Tax=Methylomonas paludis TaxID=1173101 RepID=A0A975MLT7_9GAMM|nr:hypothetical protein [Methylomonas paludis]QWF70180.1 hypothetical protein KEF85_12605 [Methylomonas paludis]
MAEFNPDDIAPRQGEVVILQTIQPHHALVKANRMLVRLVFVLLSLIFVLGFLLLPRQNILEQLGRNRSQNLAEATQNPALSAEIDNLKSQMFSLVSGSIDAKLKSIEDNIRSGSINQSLETLQSLKKDVKVLADYNPQVSAAAKQVVVEQQVFKELSELKGLIYLTIVSGGLMIAALAGVWLRHRYRINYQAKAYLGRQK